jgi:FkbM family methyltransferase
MKRILIRFIALFISRRFLWHFGRSLYMWARRDVTNRIDTNGEKRMQHDLAMHFIHKNEKLTVFDVGANIGDWTLSMIRESQKAGVGNKLEIYAFEPVSATFQILKERVGRHYPDITIHLVPQAVSSDEAESIMFVATGDKESVINSLHRDSLRIDAKQEVVSKTTADLYCLRNGIDFIHYFKSDTEGHDFEVIKGARKLLMDGKIGVLQFEYNNLWIYSRHFLKDVFDFAKELRTYHIGKLTLEGVEIYKEWHPELERFFDCNYALIKEDVLSLFTNRRVVIDTSCNWKVSFGAITH